MKKETAGFDHVGITTPFYCIGDRGPNCGKLLLGYRSAKCRDEHFKWDPGSGGLEHGLTPKENVRKEVLEEYGCEATIVGALPPHSIFRFMEHKGKQRLSHWLAIPFFVEVNPKKVRPAEPQKIPAVGWYSLETIPTALHTGFGITFQKYHSTFVEMLGRYRVPRAGGGINIHDQVRVNHGKVKVFRRPKLLGHIFETAVLNLNVDLGSEVVHRDYASRARSLFDKKYPVSCIALVDAIRRVRGELIAQQVVAEICDRQIGLSEKICIPASCCKRPAPKPKRVIKIIDVR